MQGEGHARVACLAVGLVGGVGASHEGDARVARGVLDAEDGGEDAVLRDLGVEGGHGVVDRRAGKTDLPPAAPDLEAEGARLLGVHDALGRLDCESGGTDGVDCFRGGKPARIREHAVVGHDGELAGGEEHGQEAVVGRGLVGGLIQLPITCRGASLLAYGDGRGTAMVAVGDVGVWHLPVEHQLQRLDRDLARDAPDGVAAPVLGCEVVERLARGREGDQGVDRRVVAIGEEDGAGLGVGRADVVDAVLSLGLEHVLVAVDGAVLVVVHGDAGHDARLRVALRRGKAPDVVAGLLIAQEGAVGHALVQQVAGMLVHVGRVHVVVGCEARLGTVDCQKRARVGFHIGGGACAVEDIVGRRGELGGALGRGTVAVDGIGVHGAPSFAIRNATIVAYSADSRPIAA